MNGYEEFARPGRNFFQMLEERSGRMAAAAFCTVSLWYFLAHTAVFARIWAELLRAYLAHGARVAALCVLPILAGLVYLRRGGQKASAGRYSEAVLFVLSAGLLWLAGDRASIGLFRDGAADPLRLGALFPAIGGWEAAAALLLLAGFFFAVAGGIRYTRAACAYLYAAGAEFLHGQTIRDIRRRFEGYSAKTSEAFDADSGADTEPGRSAWENGMITETVKLYRTEFADEPAAQPDGRKTKFYGIKRTKKMSALPYAGRIGLYGERIAGELTGSRIGWWAVLLTLYALMAGFADAFTAIAFYRAYNLQILVPVLLALYLYMLLSQRFGSGANRRR